MFQSDKPSILCVDDNLEILNLYRKWLSAEGYEVNVADRPSHFMEKLEEKTPQLILMDIVMPEMNGYLLCSKIHKNSLYATIPVIFITSLLEEEDRKKALSVGGVDFLSKPLKKEDLVALVKKHMETKRLWDQMKMAEPTTDQGNISSQFPAFMEFLREQSQSPHSDHEIFHHLLPSDLYCTNTLQILNLSHQQTARYIADFLKLPFLQSVSPEQVRMDVLPTAFCRKNSVLALKTPGQPLFVLSNPFRIDLMDVLSQFHFKIAIAEPQTISSLLVFNKISAPEPDISFPKFLNGDTKKSTEKTIDDKPIIQMADSILERASLNGTSDIHIEPKDDHALVRFRIDGDLQDINNLEKDTGNMLITRLKALGGMDIADRRKPQDGGFEINIEKKIYKLRITTTSTPDGESMIIRILRPHAKVKTMHELGMAELQIEDMLGFAKRSYGLVLLVGPTGSGKTTTIYSFLSQIDCKKRSLISVEDPVEYRIPNANQQQVNEKAGIGFDTLLRSSVRQDPDILFLGEIRDSNSAKVAMDFASVGHLTVSSMHTTNATTAIFRLERLGISRGVMADTILGIVAQKLIKKLCPYCKKIKPIAQKEKDMFAPLPYPIPDTIAHPTGCIKCGQTGYLGREAIYEIIKFYPQVAQLVRDNQPITKIREFIKKRGDFLLSQHAIEKVRDHIFTPQDIYYKQLIEDDEYHKEPAPHKKLRASDQLSQAQDADK